MDLGLEGKVAVVTGAGAGIGLAVCRALAAEGMRVVGASRRDPEEVVEGVAHHRLDLTEAGAVESLVERAVDRHGSLALLVNNAGARHDPGRLPVRHRRRLGAPVRAQPDGRGAGHPGGPAAPVRRRRRDRQHLLDQRGGARHGDPRLQRDQGRAELVREVDRHRVRRPRGAGRLGVARADPHGDVAGPGGGRAGGGRQAGHHARGGRGRGRARDPAAAGWPSRPRSLPSSRSWGRRGRRTSAGSTCSSTAAWSPRSEAFALARRPNRTPQP